MMSISTALGGVGVGQVRLRKILFANVCVLLPKTTAICGSGQAERRYLSHKGVGEFWPVG